MLKKIIILISFLLCVFFTQAQTLPTLQISNYSAQCAGDTLLITNTNDTNYTYYWSFNGSILDTSYHLNFIIPDSGSVWSYSEVWLHVTNGTNEDSIKSVVNVNPSGIPEPFFAWVDSVVNCDGSYSVKVYPFYKKPWWPYNLANVYRYYDGSVYHLLGDNPPPNDPYANQGEPFSLSGDTAIFHVSIHPDSIVSIRARSNYCGNGVRDTSLLVPDFYDFNAYPIVTDKELYCTTDTIKIKVPYSDPGASYTISGTNYLLTSPVIGNGDTIELFGIGKGFKYGVSVSFNVTYINTKGCGEVKLDTVYMEGVDPYFQLVPDTVNVSDYSFFYNVGDSVLLNLEEDTASVSCLWTIESELFDTAYSNCNDHYFIVNHPGNYTIRLTKTSLLGCEFESGIYQISAANMVQNFSPNLNCAFDTAFNTSWEYNSFQTLDIHKDKNGNFHTAGFGSGVGYAVRPFSFYKKYSKSKQLLFQRHELYAYQSSPSNSYNGSYLNSVTTDDDLNIYSSGTYLYQGNFRFDTLVYYTPPNTDPNIWHGYAYVTKHDSLNNLKFLILYSPLNVNSSTSGQKSAFTDIVYLNNKVYTIFNSTNYSGELLNYNVQSQTWSGSIPISIGTYLIEMDTDGGILNVVKVSSSYKAVGPNFNNGSSAGSSINTKAAKLAIDKQGRILIHYISGYWSGGFNLPVEYGSNTLSVNSSLGKSHSISAISTYDPQNGWLNGKLVAKGYVSNHNYVINNLESDAHGNKYVLSNFMFSNYDSFAWYSNQIYKTKDGIIDTDTISRLSSTISKLDVNGNFIWNKHFKNCDVIDMKITEDESHLGIVINSDGSGFSFGDSDTTMSTVNTNGRSTIFMQFSNTGVLEKMYEFGNGVKTFIGQFLHFNDDGYFQLSTRISNTDSTDFIVNGDTLFSPPYNNAVSNTQFNYATFSIDGENGQCSGVAYPGDLSDTLFIHLQNFDLCADSSVYIPWIATDTIAQVNLGYYLNGSNTKIYIANNLNAQAYGYSWTLPNFNNLDSLKFFIESTSPVFYNESETFAFFQNKNIVLLEDTTICLGESIIINPIDSFDIKWSPAQYFADPELDSAQTVSLTDSAQIYIEERNTLNGCVSHDTIKINVVPYPTASFDTLILSNSFSVINNSSGADSTEWNITNNLPFYNQDSVNIVYDTSFYNTCLIAKNSCFKDTACQLISVAIYGFDTISICSNDSIFLQNGWQNSLGNYTDTLISASNVDSILQTTLYINQISVSYDSVSICPGDSIFIEGAYQHTNGTYTDTLQSTLGCDSLLHTTLSINQIYFLNQDQSICQGDSIMIFGFYQNTTGIYYDSLQTVNGCDSILSTTLTINPVFLFNLNDSICQGDSVMLGGSYQNTFGVYYDSLQTVNGCDSILTTTLTVNPLPLVTLLNFNSDTVCIDAALSALPNGSPSGGNYIGSGVSGVNFDPQLAGAGTHDIIYTYTDGNACVNSDTTTITVEVCVTGINNINSGFGIMIYPNPNTGLFTIEKPSDLIETVQIRVLDASAKLVVAKTIVEKQQKIEVDITNYSSGLYYLQLTVGEEVFVKQILKD